MPSSSKLQSLENRKKQFESQIAELEKLINKCNQDIKAETNAANRSQLNIQIDNYSTEIDELYDKLDKIEEKINDLKLSSPELPSSNHLDNPKNQQGLIIDKYLCDIDFQQAVNTFDTIQNNFNETGDAALFVMGKFLVKRGDLCLQKLKNKLNQNTYRQSFRHYYVKYTSSENLISVIQGIAAFLKIQQEEVTIELVIKKIGDSLQNNSVVLFEIECDMNESSEIDLLIPPFINKFWQPLRKKIQEVTKYYHGIKVFGIINSNFDLEGEWLEENLFRYFNNNHNNFPRDQVIEIPLQEKWTEDDISNWLRGVYQDREITTIESLASKIYKTTDGHPSDVCCALQMQCGTLISPITSN